MPEPEIDDSPQIRLVIEIINDWFKDLDQDDMEDCAGEIVERLRLGREGNGDDEESIFT